MVKKLLGYLNPIQWFKKKEDASIVRLKKNAFHKSDPSLRKEFAMQKQILPSDTIIIKNYRDSLSPKEIVEDDWGMINWTRVSLEAKRMIINIAKTDIELQIESKNTVVPNNSIYKTGGHKQYK